MRISSLFALVVVLLGLCGMSCSSAEPRSIEEALNRLEADHGPLQSIHIYGVPESMVAGEVVYPLVAKGNFADGHQEDISESASWSSADPNIFLLQHTDGPPPIRRGVGVYWGVTTVQVEAEGIRATRTVKVLPWLAELTVSPSTLTFPLGATGQFTATGRYADGSIQDVTARAQWYAQGASVPGGFAYASYEGTFSVAAQLDGLTANATLVVTPAVVASIALKSTLPQPAVGDPPMPTVTVPDDYAFVLKAIGTYTNGTQRDLTSSVAWASDSPDVSVDASGVVRSSSVGGSYVTGSFEGVTGTLRVEVKDFRLVSAEVLPTSSPVFPIRLKYGLRPPAKSNLRLVGHFTRPDSSTAPDYDLTTSAEWSTDHPEIADVRNTIGSKGLVSPAGLGTAKVFASWPGHGSYDAYFAMSR